MSKTHIVGRLCIAVVHGGWLDWTDADDLWEAYGELARSCVHPDHWNSELALYSLVARDARVAMGVGRNQSRAGTEYRIASAVIQDISGATWRPCCSSRLCDRCGGVGWGEPSNTTRAIACKTRFPEYMNRLRPVFELVRSGLEDEFRRGKAEYKSSYQYAAAQSSLSDSARHAT